MKIKRLELCGFKSFVDRTVLVFDHDITCVVGPNGCGKSNIVDAIRWVMGEQGAKALRGQGMEDVIFGGSEGREPVNVAEVSITFDNTDGLTPIEYRDYPEITVTRKLSRKGDSEYLINKTSVRLLDVTNLFLGTGVGRKAYSIVEQGRVGFIVSSKPEERRYLIEEAAGTTKFKARRKAAQRKMEQTQQNMLRVGDIVREIEKNLGSLKRQAQKAERYKSYRQELRDLELWFASHRWLELFGQSRTLDFQVKQVAEELETARQQESAIEAQYETERVEVQLALTEVEQVQRLRYEADHAVQMLEQEATNHLVRVRDIQETMRSSHRELANMEQSRTALAEEQHNLEREHELLRDTFERVRALLSEREREASLASERRQLSAEALARQQEEITQAVSKLARAEAMMVGYETRKREGEERLQRVEEEFDQSSEQQRKVATDREEVALRIEGLNSGKEQSAETQKQLEEKLTELRQSIQLSDRQVEQVRERLSDCRSRLRSLREIEERREGVGAGVRALLTRDTKNTDVPSQITGLLADRISCPPEWTEALASALGERIQYVLVTDEQAGCEALKILQSEKLGRATVFPIATVSSMNESRAVHSRAANLDGVSGVVGRLSDVVECEVGDRPLVERLLADVWIVEDLQQALKVHRDSQFAGWLVTANGELVSPEGAMTGGSGEDPGAHIITMKREVRGLEHAVAELDQELTVAVEHHRGLRAAIVESQSKLESARMQAHENQLAIVKANEESARIVKDGERIERRLSELQLEQTRIKEQLSLSELERAEAQRVLDEVSQEREEAASRLSELENELRTHDEALRDINEAFTEIKIEAAQAEQKERELSLNSQRIARSVDELQKRQQRLEREIAQADVNEGELTTQVILIKERLFTAIDEAQTLATQLESLRETYDIKQRTIHEIEEQLKEMRSGVAQNTQEAHARDTQRREVVIKLESLREQVLQSHRIEIEHALIDYHVREIPGGAEQTRLQDLSGLIERMGEINLSAINDYATEAARYEVLSSQQRDLEESLTELEQAIRQMNRESRRLFKEAFEAINERFKRAFPAMFGGGKAELKLTNPEDLLESGVELIAMPPGKRLGSIELMSGGEKALTAISLVFAIFQYKPSPFCLLDEVDAPLDDANVGRFNDAVRQMTDRSQFILITHSKGTMEMADVLYGVTMETPGISKMVSVEIAKQADRARTQAEYSSAVA